MDLDRPPLSRIIEEELVGNRILSHFYYPKYVKALELTGNERVLEFGSGGGLMSRALIQVINRGGSLTCVDISEYWIKKAQKRMRDFSNVEFRLGDITQMDLPDNAYDTVVIHFVLHDIDPAKRIDVMNALTKLLRPEGTMVIREPVKPGHGIPLAEIRTLMRDCGLREHRSGCTKSWRWKWVCDGVFIKSW